MAAELELADLVPAGPSDSAFVASLLATDASAELAAIPPEVREHLVAVQVRARLDSYEADWPDAAGFIITADSVPVGRILLAGWEGTAADTIHVVDFRIAQSRRGRGVGSSALGRVITRASLRGSTVALHVRRDSAAARFYRRHGFHEAGATGTDLHLELQPAAGAGRPRRHGDASLIHPPSRG